MLQAGSIPALTSLPLECRECGGKRVTRLWQGGGVGRRGGGRDGGTVQLTLHANSRTDQSWVARLRVSHSPVALAGPAPGRVTLTWHQQGRTG